MKPTKKSPLFRALACAMIVCMGAGTIAGCGGGGTANETSSAAVPASPSSSASSAPASSASSEAASSASGERAMEGNLYLEGAPIVKEKETYRIATLKHPLDTGTFPEKYAVKRTEEETNIHIEWLEIPNTDFETKVNLMFATGDLPDMIVGGVNASAINKNKPALVKLDEYFEKYAPTLYDVYYNQYPNIAKELTYPDGHIYSFETNMATAPTNACAGIFWYHKKMFEETGLPIPTTVDEYYESLKKIKEQHPESIPLTSCENIWSTKFNQLTGPWGILSATVDPGIDENGKVYFPVTTDAFYECLKFYNKLSSEGLYDKESFGQTVEQARAKGNEGVVATFLAYNPAELVGDTLKTEYDYFKEPLKGPDGTQLWHGQQDKPTGWREGAVLTTSCKSPETMMRWMDYINSSLELKLCWQNGEPGKDFIIDDLGKWHKTTPEEQKAMGYTAPEGGNWTTGNGDHAPVFLTLADLAMQDNSFDNDDAKLRAAAVDAMRPFFPKSQQFFPRIYQEDDVIDARSNMRVELDAYLKEFIATSVVNGIDDAKWQNHLEQMKKLKADEYIASYQSLYDAGKVS